MAFDLVNLLASVPSSGGRVEGASGSGGSSIGGVRRSPKQTMHDSAMLRECLIIATKAYSLIKVSLVKARPSGRERSKFELKIWRGFK